MRPALVAGALYFIVLFAAGFVLGALRVLWLAPQLGVLLALLIELPIMLVFAWFAALALARRCEVPPRAGPRLAMGGVMLVLLLAAEFALSAVLPNTSPAEHLAAYTTASGALGPAAQLLAAALPLIDAVLRSLRTSPAPSSRPGP